MTHPNNGELSTERQLALARKDVRQLRRIERIAEDLGLALEKRFGPFDLATARTTEASLAQACFDAMESLIEGEVGDARVDAEIRVDYLQAKLNGDADVPVRELVMKQMGISP